MQIRAGAAFLGQGTSTIASSGNTTNGIASSHAIYHYGLGSKILFDNLMGIAPSLDIYTDEYVYLAQHGRAFITQVETGSQLGALATVLGVGVNFPWALTLPISEIVELNILLGINFTFRIPVTPLDGSQDISPIGNYLLSEGKWFNIYLEPSMGIRITESLGFLTGFKVILPIWHIWDSYDLPFIDHFQAGVVVGLEFYL